MKNKQGEEKSIENVIVGNSVLLFVQNLEKFITATRRSNNSVHCDFNLLNIIADNK